MPYDKSTQKKYGENPLPQKSSGFKMKGSPMKRNFGIGADSPMKETTRPSYTGADIDPRLSYEYKGAKIPSFRDFVSLEQQQAYADKVDKRRDDKKSIKDAGGGTYREYKKDMGKGNAMSKKDWTELNLKNIEGAKEEEKNKKEVITSKEKSNKSSSENDGVNTIEKINDGTNEEILA